MMHWYWSAMHHMLVVKGFEVDGYVKVVVAAVAAVFVVGHDGSDHDDHDVVVAVAVENFGSNADGYAVVVVVVAVAAAVVVAVVENDVGTVKNARIKEIQKIRMKVAVGDHKVSTSSLALCARPNYYDCQG